MTVCGQELQVRNCRDSETLRTEDWGLGSFTGKQERTGNFHSCFSNVLWFVFSAHLFNTCSVRGNLILTNIPFYIKRNKCLSLLLLFYCHDKAPWPIQLLKVNVYWVSQFQRGRVRHHHGRGHSIRQACMRLWLRTRILTYGQEAKRVS